MAIKKKKICTLLFKLKEIRLAMNLTQEEVSEMTGLSRQALVKLENNPQGWYRETIEKICAGLDVGPDQLFEMTVEEP